MASRGLAGVAIALAGALAGGPAARTSPSGAAQAAVVDALERYSRGDFDAAVDALAAPSAWANTVRRFRADAGAWIAADRTPVQPPARLKVAAALGLELVDRGVRGTVLEYRDVSPLVEWACSRLRRLEPSEFERVFHLAAVALLQGARDEEQLIAAADPGRRHLAHAVERFPREPRLRLALVTVRRPAQLISGFPLAPGFLLNAGAVDPEPARAPRVLQETLDLLGHLVDNPEVGEEARLRRGVLRFTMGEPAAARPDLIASARAADPFVRYLSHTMLGLVDERLGQPDAAIEHYAAAVRVVPATTASVALASALFRQGRAAEAGALVEAWLPAERPVDPWWQYGFRDYRLLPGYRDWLRAAAVAPDQAW